MTNSDRESRVIMLSHPETAAAPQESFAVSLERESRLPTYRYRRLWLANLLRGTTGRLPDRRRWDADAIQLAFAGRQPHYDNAVRDLDPNRSEWHLVGATRREAQDAIQTLREAAGRPQLMSGNNLVTALRDYPPEHPLWAFVAENNRRMRAAMTQQGRRWLHPDFEPPSYADVDGQLLFDRAEFVAELLNELWDCFREAFPVGRARARTVRTRISQVLENKYAEQTGQPATQLWVRRLPGFSSAAAGGAGARPPDLHGRDGGSSSAAAGGSRNGPVRAIVDLDL